MLLTNCEILKVSCNIFIVNISVEYFQLNVYVIFVAHILFWFGLFLRNISTEYFYGIFILTIPAECFPRIFPLNISVEYFC